jgi:tetratricopeptide (TPR) repeat protein
MSIRVFLLVLLPCLVCAGPVAADVQTFGLDGGQATLAARPRIEWVRQAQALERHGDWPGLLAWGQAWARVDAKNPLAWFVQGRALDEMGRLPEAIAAYQQNVRIAPGDVLARNNLGNAYRDSGRPREAMQAYRAAVEIDPDYIPDERRGRGGAGAAKAAGRQPRTGRSLACARSRVFDHAR